MMRGGLSVRAEPLSQVRGVFAAPGEYAMWLSKRCRSVYGALVAHVAGV
jgi:hypothetical protein